MVDEFQPDKFRPVCVEAARKHGVVPDVHPKDFIFQFLVKNPSFTDTTKAVQYYFNDGAHSAEKLSRLLHEVRGDTDSGLQLLEFASGYGCVTRHLAHFLPDAEIASCDIHEEAIDFLQNRIGVPAIPSNSVPEKLEVPCHYDVVFALSFFSHMPRKQWRRWLLALTSKLKTGGLLVFTTHGIESRKWFDYPRIGSDGFWFTPQSEQLDLDAEEYGQTILLPHFVFGQVKDETEARIILFREAQWWEHQDLYVLKRM